nr:MAG TPA_asm: hypothetical protein [Caudoviricetes sp.]
MRSSTARSPTPTRRCAESAAGRPRVRERKRRSAPPAKLRTDTQRPGSAHKKSATPHGRGLF